MIANLLDINKSQEDRLVAARNSVDVQDLVVSAIGDLQTRATAASLVISANVDADRAELDRDLVRRVLANLIENAIRHAPEHTTITVTARRSDGALQLCVADAGPGVPAELRAHLFERFASAGPRANHGLGLAFCRVAAAAHGGRIWVEDGTPGAVFCVEIPDAR
jgi:K+-sensing histidine kinase KdpD